VLAELVFTVRAYRWPRDGEPCLFLAVASAGATFTRL
jgi:hypothetical protein